MSSPRPFGARSPLSSLLLDAQRKARRVRRPRAPEGRPQLPEFVAMTRDPVTELDVEARCVRGAIPVGLRTRYFAGGWYTRPEPAIPHLLDAYTAMVGWYLADGAARVRVRPIDDPVRDEELASGRILRNGMAVRTGGSLRGLVNTAIGRANVHECVVHRGEVLAATHLRTLRIDPDTLACRPEDAFAGAFAADDPFIVQNNHPQVDPRTGNLVTAFYRNSVLYSTEAELFEVDPSGRRVSARRHWSPEFNAAHAFGFTDSSYLVPDNPLNAPGLAFVLHRTRGVLDAIRANPARGLRLHVVPRGEGGEAQVVDLPQRGFLYHLVNAYDEGDVTVVDAFVTNLDPLLESSQFELDPTRRVVTAVGSIQRFRVDRRAGQATAALLVPGVQQVTFDCIDERRRGQPYTRAWFVANSQHESGRSEVLAADVASGRVARWQTTDRVFFRQPRVAPWGPGEADGWLIVPAYTPSDSQLWIFDAADVTAGPVAVLSAGARLPYTNHGGLG